MTDIEHRETPEIQERTREGGDPNGDRWQQQERYRETVDPKTGEVREQVLWAHGSIIEGPSRGHEWVKGSGGRIEGSPHRIERLGLNAELGEVTPGRWGAVLAQGDNPDKPEAGETWFWGEAMTAEQPTAVHTPDALRAERSDLIPDPRNPNRRIALDQDGREVFSLETPPDRPETITRTTTYFDGYQITTGRKVVERLDPSTGEPVQFENFWEERRSTDEVNDQELNLALTTEAGRLDQVRLRGTSRDLALNPDGTLNPDAQRDLPLHLLMRGGWTAPAELPKQPAAST